MKPTINESTLKKVKDAKSFFTQNFDTPKRKNRSEIAIDDSVITEISQKGLTFERLLELKKNLPIFTYKTQITVHGVPKDFDYLTLAGRKWVFQNQNKSIGIKYGAIDVQKKKRIKQAVNSVGFGATIGPNGLMVNKLIETSKEHAKSDLEKTREQFHKQLDLKSFLGKGQVGLVSLWGQLYVLVNVIVYAIPEDSIEGFLEAFGVTKEAEEAHAKAKKKKEDAFKAEMAKLKEEAKEKMEKNIKNWKAKYPVVTDVPNDYSEYRIFQIQNIRGKYSSFQHLYKYQKNAKGEFYQAHPFMQYEKGKGKDEMNTRMTSLNTTRSKFENGLKKDGIAFLYYAKDKNGMEINVSDLVAKVADVEDKIFVDMKKSTFTEKAEGAVRRYANLRGYSFYTEANGVSLQNKWEKIELIFEPTAGYNGTGYFYPNKHDLENYKNIEWKISQGLMDVKLPKKDRNAAAIKASKMKFKWDQKMPEGIGDFFGLTYREFVVKYVDVYFSSINTPGLFFYPLNEKVYYGYFFEKRNDYQTNFDLRSVDRIFSDSSLRMSNGHWELSFSANTYRSIYVPTIVVKKIVENITKRKEKDEVYRLHFQDVEGDFGIAEMKKIKKSHFKKGDYVRELHGGLKKGIIDRIVMAKDDKLNPFLKVFYTDYAQTQHEAKQDDLGLINIVDKQVHFENEWLAVDGFEDLTLRAKNQIGSLKFKIGDIVRGDNGKSGVVESMEISYGSDLKPFVLVNYNHEGKIIHASQDNLDIGEKEDVMEGRFKLSNKNKYYENIEKFFAANVINTNSLKLNERKYLLHVRIVKDSIKKGIDLIGLAGEQFGDNILDIKNGEKVFDFTFVGVEKHNSKQIVSDIKDRKYWYFYFTPDISEFKDYLWRNYYHGFYVLKENKLDALAEGKRIIANSFSESIATKLAFEVKKRNVHAEKKSKFWVDGDGSIADIDNVGDLYRFYQNNLSNQKKDVHILGKKTKLRLPNGETRPAQWAVVEANWLKASHNERTFASTPGYPVNRHGHNINDRNYANDKNAQALVERYARELKPDLLITNNKTPQGTPIINEDGIVVSGNNRTMSIKLAIADYPENYQAYVEELKDEWEVYQFEKEVKALRDMQNPVLVRIDYGIEELNTNELAKYNQLETKGKRPVDKAIELSNILMEKEGCSIRIPQILEKYERMSDFYANRSDQAKMVKMIKECNLLTEQEMATYYDEKAGFTDAGKNFLEATLSATVLSKDAITVSEKSGVKSLRRIIVTTLPTLMQNKGLDQDSLTSCVNDAILYQSDIVSSGVSFGNYINQKALFAEKNFGAKCIIINRLMNAGRNKFKNAIQGYTDTLKNAAGANMFGDAPDADEAFKYHIWSKIPKEEQKLIEQFTEWKGDREESESMIEIGEKLEDELNYLLLKRGDTSDLFLKDAQKLLFGKYSGKFGSFEVSKSWGNSLLLQAKGEFNGEKLHRIDLRPHQVVLSIQRLDGGVSYGNRRKIDSSWLNPNTLEQLSKADKLMMAALSSTRMRNVLKGDVLRKKGEIDREIIRIATVSNDKKNWRFSYTLKPVKGNYSVQNLPSVELWVAFKNGFELIRNGVKVDPFFDGQILDKRNSPKQTLQKKIRTLKTALSVLTSTKTRTPLEKALRTTELAISVL